MFHIDCILFFFKMMLVIYLVLNGQIGITSGGGEACEATGAPGAQDCAGEVKQKEKRWKSNDGTARVQNCIQSASTWAVHREVIGQYDHKFPEKYDEISKRGVFPIERNHYVQHSFPKRGRGDQSPHSQLKTDHILQ